MKSKNINQLVLAGVLCGIGIVVPMLMPKIVIGPMSFTLASHVAIFYCDVHIAEAGRSSLLGNDAGLFYDDACNYCSEGCQPYLFCPAWGCADQKNTGNH